MLPVVFAQPSGPSRVISGVVVTAKEELVPGVTISSSSRDSEVMTISDSRGSFRLVAPQGALTLKLSGKNIAQVTRRFEAAAATENLRLQIEYVVPPIHESIVIVDSSVDPGIERRNEEIYRSALFSRDDQIFDTLAAGINAGQHEGGGKSLEIRRFGFNMDHGGLFGGFKVLVDDVQQNFGTQGHGQGYLGQLKGLTPELVQQVEILNGPFSAQYGDFSGLGVAHVRTREALPDVLTLRVQGSSFNTYRTFFGVSPTMEKAVGLISYEGSRTDGPFKNPLRYKRDNVTGNYTRNIGEKSALGLRFNFGRNDFFSSGQLPVDEVFAGRLDRFGAIDPDNGGRVRSGTGGVYYRRDIADGGILKIDGFLTRSLFDLWSNFTFFLADTEFGDEIQQHDSRFQQGANLQYLRPITFLGARSLLTVGGNLQSFQTNVGLYPSVDRNPNRADARRVNLTNCPVADHPGQPGFPDKFQSSCFLVTSAAARVINTGVYAQQAVDLLEGHLHLEGGLRYDYFRFNVEDRIRRLFSGQRGEGRLQPKATLAYTPSHSFPTTIHFNYGRGISSQDARGVVRRLERPRVTTTDFYQLGTSHNHKRISVSAALFLIDNSNQQVYIPDDGSIELAGPTRAYGFEIKSSMQVTSQLAFNSGLTQVMNSFYRGTSPREYVDSAPHTVANAGLTLSDYHCFSGSLRYRHTGNYRLDPLDARIRAAGLDVVDFSLTRKIRRFVDFNFAIDNLLNKRFFETQNYFKSRVRPDADAVERIHATPGYPLNVTVGLTFKFLPK